jgi:hypothetical protein
VQQIEPARAKIERHPEPRYPLARARSRISRPAHHQGVRHPRSSRSRFHRASQRDASGAAWGRAPGGTPKRRLRGRASADSGSLGQPADSWAEAGVTPHRSRRPRRGRRCRPL